MTVIVLFRGKTPVQKRPVELLADESGWLLRVDNGDADRLQPGDRIDLHMAVNQNSRLRVTSPTLGMFTADGYMDH